MCPPKVTHLHFQPDNTLTGRPRTHSNTYFTQKKEEGRWWYETAGNDHSLICLKLKITPHCSSSYHIKTPIAFLQMIAVNREKIPITLMAIATPSTTSLRETKPTNTRRLSREPKHICFFSFWTTWFNIVLVCNQATAKKQIADRIPESQLKA